MNSQKNDKMPRDNDELDFLELVCCCLDDQLSAGELENLNEQLRGNAAHRETFVRYCLQGKLLAEAFVAGVPLAGDASRIPENIIPTKTSAAPSMPISAFLIEARAVQPAGT